ncbi:MAG: HAD-IA family hydrolase [Spirochaetes bacterium]|nr:HAD-IA family hydrolase [Spirochaetota bacterium]
MKLKAVLFDLDGTLLDTLPDIRDAMNAVLARHDLPQYDMESYRGMIGWGIGRLAELAIPEEFRSEVDAAELAEEMRRAYLSHPLESSVPFEGVPQLIEALHTAGVPMGVLSNKVHELTHRLIARAWGEGVFRAVYGARDDLPMKPHPEAAQRIASELGVEPYQVVFVGDTAIDMETAQVAGMYPVGVGWGYREVEELWMHGAAMVVSSPDEIPPLTLGGAHDE